MAVVFDDRPDDAPRRLRATPTQPGSARRAPVARPPAPGAPPPRRRRPGPAGAPPGEPLPARPLRSLRPRRATPSPVVEAVPAPPAETTPRQPHVLRRSNPMQTRTHGGA